MGFIASAKSGVDYDPVPQGLHLAACVGLFDIGTITSERWGKSQHKIILKFELPECEPIEMNIDGKTVKMPRTVSREFTISLSEKATLRAILEGWRGRKFTEQELGGFDISKVLGASAQVQIIHADSDGKTYANINAVLPAPKGVKVATTTPQVLFSVDDLTTPEVPDTVPPWIAKKVQESLEFQRLVKQAANRAPAPGAKAIAQQSAATQAPPPEEDPDDIPF